MRDEDSSNSQCSIPCGDPVALSSLQDSRSYAKAG